MYRQEYKESIIYPYEISDSRCVYYLSEPEIKKRCMFIKFNVPEFSPGTVAYAAISLQCVSTGEKPCASVNVYGITDNNGDIDVNNIDPDSIRDNAVYLSTYTSAKNYNGRILYNVTDFISGLKSPACIIFAVEPNGIPNFNQRMEYSEPFLVVAEGKPASDDLDILMSPFWNSEIIKKEPVLVLSRDGKVIDTNLMFEPDEIISVTNAALNKVYEVGKDVDFIGSRLVIPEGSAVPVTDYNVLYTPKDQEGAKGYPGFDNILINPMGPKWFLDNLLSITYRRKADSVWNGPVPSYDKNKLKGTIKKLQNRNPVKLALHGDSISFGWNASGNDGMPPYLPTWGNLIKMTLEKHYKSQVTLVNASLGGTRAVWGHAVSPSYITPVKPDLLIIGFGMNGEEDPDSFIESIKGIINSTLSGNPDCEFILASSMMANSKWICNEVRRAKYDALKELANNMDNAVYADVWGVHEAILKRKNFYDTTHNNLNHPNDFLVRIYAQVISEALLI